MWTAKSCIRHRDSTYARKELQIISTRCHEIHLRKCLSSKADQNPGAHLPPRVIKTHTFFIRGHHSASASKSSDSILFSFLRTPAAKEILCTPSPSPHCCAARRPTRRNPTNQAGRQSRQKLWISSHIKYKDVVYNAEESVLSVRRHPPHVDQFSSPVNTSSAPTENYIVSCISYKYWGGGLTVVFPSKDS